MERVVAPVAVVRAPEPLLRDLLGRVLRRVRRAEHRTLQDVATAARISIAYLSEIERGRKEPSSEVLVAVCRALGIRVVDLLAEAATELLAAELTTDLRSGHAMASRGGREMVLRSGHAIARGIRTVPDVGPTARLSVA